MTKVYCNYKKCKFNTHLTFYTGICSKDNVLLNPYPKYLSLAKKFKGTIRCMDCEE